MLWFSLFSIFLYFSSVSCVSQNLFNPGDVTRFFFSPNLSCGGTSRLKKIVLKNPAELLNDCKYTIKPSNTKICQLRIDFDTILAQPRAINGSYPKCLDDVFRINNFELCGTNIKQHIYVPFDVKRMNEAIEIQLNISDRLENPTLGAVMWSATVHQLECPEKSFISSYDKLLAPVGCLQYHTELNGTIESFNFNQGNGPYLGNISYAICFKRPSSHASLNLKTIAFELSKAAPQNDGYDMDCVPQIRTIGASEDHITVSEAIKHSDGTNDIRASKFCGKSLVNSTVIVNASLPFAVHFFSDDRYDQTSNNTERGFKFQYKIV